MCGQPKPDPAQTRWRQKWPCGQVLSEGGQPLPVRPPVRRARFHLPAHREAQSHAGAWGRSASGRSEWGMQRSPAGTRRHALGRGKVDSIEPVFERMGERVLDAIRIDRGPRINVGPQIVPRHAIKALSHQHIFSRKLPRLVEPTPDRGLRCADIAGELGLPAGLFHSGLEGFEAGGVRFHTHRTMRFRIAVSTAKIIAPVIRMRIRP